MPIHVSRPRPTTAWQESDKTRLSYVAILDIFIYVDLPQYGIFAWMIDRRIQNKIQSFLDRNPAVALIGPRQVGKTTVALNIADCRPSVYLDLEKPRDLAKISDIEAFHTENRGKLIIVDEIQRSPEIFAPLRGIIDKERRRGNKVGQFLFLGSASLDLLKQSSETLAGRLAYIELHPIDSLEWLGHQKKQSLQRQLTRLWLRGGFPESLLTKSDEDSLDWRDDFLQTYLERDIPQLGPRIPAETLRRFWTMLAHHQGTMVNAAHLARNLGVSGQSVTRYLDLLVDLLLVRRLQPWTANIGKRLVRAPKIYVRDSGITHALLNIQTFNDLMGHPVIGGSWEGFVIENILSVTPSRIKSYFYRTSGGAEIDLLLELTSRERWAIEIKRSSAPSLSRGFYSACEDVKATKRFVVYAGEETFPLGQESRAISLTDLMKELSQ